MCFHRRRRTLLLLAAIPLPAVAQQAPPVAPPVSAEVLDPGSPLAPLPEIGVAWPDLDTAPGAGEPGAAPVIAETRYRSTIAGLDDAEHRQIDVRFGQLSTLRAHEGDAANAAQIDRRAREDAELLVTLLRAAGYYDARVTTRVEPQEGRLLVTLEANPGTLYRFDRVTLPGLAGAGDKADALTGALGIKADDPVDADTIVAATARLRTQIGEEGFAFADVAEPRITVDHATRTATLDLSVTPGEARTFGQIVAPRNRVFGADHIQDIARFLPGEPYRASEVDDLRRALIQTGLVSSAQVTPVAGTTPGTVDLQVALEPAPPRTVAAELGYGTGEGARGELSWTHRNLFPPEGALTVRGVLGTREQLGSVGFRRNNWGWRDRVLNFQVAAAHVQRDAYDARTFSLAGSVERQTNIFFRKTWTWSLGGELLASDERDVILATGAPRQRTYFIAAAPTSLNYDGSDDLLNPTRGFRLGGRASPEFSFVGRAFGYTRVQLDYSVYRPIVDGVVLAGRARAGTILGAPRGAIAPSRRFYAGGGASVRGYGYQDIGPRDPNNDPIGGRSLTEFAIEARVNVLGSFGVVPFLDAGNIYTSVAPKLTDLRFGAGLGVRYYSNFGPIRVDVGTPLTPQKGDPRVAVYVSLGQAF